MQIRIGKILCPLDFSDSSEHALQYAVALASAYHAELLLLHVVELPVYVASGEPLDPGFTAQVSRELTESADKRLKEATDRIQPQHPRVSRRIATGVPFLEIIQTARKESVDLIVLGTHGRTGLVHALIGSVAERVARKAPCPVLSVKNPGHDFVMP